MPAGLAAAALAANTVLSPPAVRPPCHTPKMLDFGFRTGAAGEGMRPDSVGYVDSEIYPIRVHYRRESDADRAAEVVLPAAENAWAVEVEQMGWPEPVSDDGLGGNDSVDYYLTNESTYGGAWTWGPRTDTIEGDDFYSVAAFMAIDDTGSITNSLMPTFVNHEFNHVLQFVIDGSEETHFVWESTAEAMEVLVDPEDTVYESDIPDFQSLPFASLLFDGYDSRVADYDSYSTYEYGGAISGLYLEQAFGESDGTTLLQLWLDLAQGDNSDEPDYVDALRGIGGDTARNLEEVYLGLAEWRMFAADDDDGAHYTWASGWNQRSKVATEATLLLSELSGTEVSPVDEPYDLGASYWEIEVDDDTDETLHLELTGDEAVSWGIVAAAWLDGEPARVVQAYGDEGELVTADLDLSGATKVMVGVANLGANGLDADGRHQRVGFTLALQVGEPEEDTDTGEIDTGGGDDTDHDDTAEEDPGDPPKKAEGDKGGCGCSSSGPAPGSGAALVLLALGAALVGRRRT